MTGPLETFTLTVTEIDVLAEHLELPPVLFPIVVPSVGDTDVDRHAIAGRTWQELTDRGLVRRGRPEPEVEDALRMLIRPARAVSALAVLDNGRMLRARGASNGPGAVLAHQTDERVRIEFVSPGMMLPLTVDLIGLVKPGPGKPVSVPVGRTEAVVDTGGFLEHIDPIGDARRAASVAVWEQPRLRAGAFTPHTTDRHGRVRQGAELDWFDTAKGRYAVHSNNQHVLTCAPADNPMLAAQLSSSLADLLSQP